MLTKEYKVYIPKKIKFNSLKDLQVDDSERPIDAFY